MALTLPAPVTVPIALVHGLLSGVRSRGESVEPLLIRVGIAPELLEQDAAWVTAAQWVALFELLIDRLDDEALALLSRPLRRGSFALVARAGISAPDLDSALQRIARTFTLIQDDVIVQLGRDGSRAGLSLVLRDASVVRHPFLHMLLLRTFWRLATWLIDAKLPATTFDFAFERPAHVASYAKVFPATLRFEQDRSTVWFDAAKLDLPVRRDETALRNFLADSPATIVLRHVEGMTYAVRSQLQRRLPEWVDLGTVANALAMAPSTLQRRLGIEKTTFQFLKDEMRRDIAITRLNTSTVSLAALASELGFADSPAFQRAFKSWTGGAAGSYRRGKA
jgi:AraC-like DNA-binding protein